MEKEKTIKIGDQEVKVTKTGQQLTKGQTFSAIVVGSLVGLLAISGLPKQNIDDWFSNIFNKNESITQDDEENKDLTYEDYANMEIKYSQEELSKMSYEELANVLTEYNGIPQREVFDLLEKTQNYMNETTLPSIKLESDGENQLYLNANEVISTYIMVNADTISKEEMVRIFGNSGLLNAEKINDNYLSTIEFMEKYYSRATQRSGISNLFVDEEDKKIVEKYEDLIIAYNTAETTEAKKQAGIDLVNYLEELTDIVKADGPIKTNKGGTLYVANAGIHVIHAFRLIDEEHYEKLKNRVELSGCDYLRNETEDMETLANNLYNKTLEQGLYKKVIKELPRAMDAKNVKALSRDVLFGNYESSSYSNSYGSGKVTYYPGRSKAEAEQAAREEFEAEYGPINRQNEIDAEQYRLGYNAGYETAYYYAAANGSIASSSTSGSAKYQEGYRNGVQVGYADGMVEYNAKQNAKPIEEVIETPVQPSNPTPTPTQPTPNPEPEPTPVQPAPTPVPETPVVVETPGSSDPVVPDVGAGEEYDPEFVGTSTNNLDNRYFGIVDQDEFTVTYLVSEKPISRVRSL